MNIGDTVMITSPDTDLPETYVGTITAHDERMGTYEIDANCWVRYDHLMPWDATTIEVSVKNQRCTPERHGDWVDLKAATTIRYKAGEFNMVSLGVAMKLPPNCEAHVVPRSSTFAKYGVIQTNGIGIIDEKYCGNNDIWMFPALAMRDGVIHEGDRIAQFRIVPKMKAVVFKMTTLKDKDRGGFGSTGN